MAQQNVIQAVQNYGKQLFRFIRGRVPTDEDAEDILQDVWYQLSNQPEVDAIESVSGWLYRVARNRITDWFRKKRPDSLEDYDVENGALEEWNFDSLEDEALRELFWEEVFAALEELPEKQRQVFVLNEIEGLTLQQIADQQGENLKTIISRKGYAVKKLRERLEDLYDEIADY